MAFRGLWFIKNVFFFWGGVPLSRDDQRGKMNEGPQESHIQHGLLPSSDLGPGDFRLLRNLKVELILIGLMPLDVRFKALSWLSCSLSVDGCSRNICSAFLERQMRDIARQIKKQESGRKI